MKNTIPTAEEFFKDTEITYKDTLNKIIEFTKLHVATALEAAYYNAEFKEAGLEDEDICSTFNSDYDVVLVLDKESILESYPPENIK